MRRQHLRAFRPFVLDRKDDSLRTQWVLAHLTAPRRTVAEWLLGVFEPSDIGRVIPLSHAELSGDYNGLALTTGSFLPGGEVLEDLWGDRSGVLPIESQRALSVDMSASKHTSVHDAPWALASCLSSSRSRR
jgi:hypothetical protein